MRALATLPATEVLKVPNKVEFALKFQPWTQVLLQKHQIQSFNQITTNLINSLAGIPKPAKS